MYSVIVPDQPSVSVTGTTATSISISWSVPSGSVVDSYEVMWQRDTSGECSDEDEGNTNVTDGSTSYDIMGLAGMSSYTITVTATNVAGSSAVSDAVTRVTGAAGKKEQLLLEKFYLKCFYTSSSVCCSHFCECI